VTHIKWLLLSRPWRKQRERRKSRLKMKSPSESRVLSILISTPTSHRCIRNSSTRSRWRILPPEILRMILQYLATDKETLHACSQTAHDFRHVALSFLGRHLTINDVHRLKECAKLVARGAFQHVRSLDLGVTNKRVILQGDWMNYLAILGEFARYHSLNRLWLSEVPFNFAQRGQKKTLRETITALGSTVTELGLYGCHFSSYEEMISLVRSFPLCNFLFIRDCVTGGHAASGNARLPGFPNTNSASKISNSPLPRRTIC